MGLLDIIQGISNGPRAQGPTGSGGVSPLAMGLLALMAYKALHRDGTLSSSSPAAGDGGVMASLQNALGGAMAGGPGTIVSGGLGQLIGRLQQNGLNDVASSWLGNGSNKPISPGDVENAAGSDTLDVLAKEIGVSRSELLQRLTAELPQTVDHLTPQGRVPTAQEASQIMKST